MNQQGVLLLKNRTACALVSLCFLILSGWSWTSIAKGDQHRVELSTALFSFVLMFFYAYYAYKSPFWADRFVSNAFAGILALIVVRYAALPPLAMFAANVAKATIATIAGVVSLVALANTRRTSSNDRSSRG